MIRTTVVALACLFALAGCGSDDSDNASEADTSAAKPQSTALQEAYDACAVEKFGNPLAPPRDQLEGASVMSLEDEGMTVIVDGAGDQYASGGAAFCLLEQIDAPAATVSNMEATTSMMGRQSDAWDGYEAQWSFHPDNGFDLVLESAENE